LFTTSFAQRELVAEHDAAWMLSHLVGLLNAADVLYSARRVNAYEALRLGLVQRVVAEATVIGDYEMARGFESEDFFREDAAHFLEKRPPKFTRR